MPVSTNKILWSKILASDLLVIPPLLLCLLLVFIKFTIPVGEMVCITLATIITPNLSAMWGLLINLRYPKMSFTSEMEVVKQSSSVMVTSLSGMLFSILFAGVLIAVPNKLMIMIIELVALLLLSLLFASIIKKWGVKKFNSINV